MRIRGLKWLFVLAMTLFMTGCWDNVEINERHIVLEIAVDKAKSQKNDGIGINQDRYKITYTIPDIGKLSGEDSLGEEVKNSIVTESQTLAESIDEIETKTQNTISFSHTKLLVLGEELLQDKEAFRGLMDGLMRNMQLGRDTLVLATKGEAGEITKAKNAQNPILGLYVMKYFDNHERPQSYAKEQTIGRMITEIQDAGVTIIPMISVNNKGNIQIEGGAVIKNYKLVDWLNKEETRGLLFVEGRVKNVPITVNYRGESLTYFIEREKSKIKFEFDQNDLNTIIDVYSEGNITEYISSQSNKMFNEKEIGEIAELIQDEIKKEIQVTIEKSKELKMDFLNIGLEMYRKHPKEWGDYYVSWESKNYGEMLIKVNAAVSIKNTGLLE